MSTPARRKQKTKSRGLLSQLSPERLKTVLAYRGPEASGDQSLPKVPRMIGLPDYDAWNRGYMPPSEHILIDQLAYRGATVILSSHSTETGYWLVFKGPRIRPRQALAIQQEIEFALQCLQAEEEADPAEAALLNAPFPEPPHDRG
jgi:hypothetical protein